ncbi:MAG TPA: hypothetical protein VFB62_05960 [Polyangiaceae bacterium]|jgi:hypothetical protein|nr:hypothetical protein [Polyangiaceae bacterium]
MLIEVAIAAAVAAGVASLLRMRARRRARRAAEKEAAQTPAAPAPPPEELPIALGAVVQHEGMSRWLRARIAFSEGTRTVSALFIADEAGAELAVTAFAPPERDILWLERVVLTMPPSPPTRLEIEGRLFDRRAVMPLAARCEGKNPPSLQGSVMFAVYDGAESRAALVLQAADVALVYHGLRIGPEDWEVLGHVDPASDELGTA